MLALGNFMNRAEIPMIECSGGARLVHESFLYPSLHLLMWQRKLQRDRTVQLEILG